LRGNARTSGIVRQKEAGNVFGGGSRTPISITILVKNPERAIEKADIKYHEIGDYLSQQEKLKIIDGLGSISNPKMDWRKLLPNKDGDWVNQRNESFEEFIEIASRENKKELFFNINSNGVVTSRDAWVYNYSKTEIENNMKQTTSFYEEQLHLFRPEKEKTKMLKLGFEFGIRIVTKAPSQIESEQILRDIVASFNIHTQLDRVWWSRRGFW